MQQNGLLYRNQSKGLDVLVASLKSTSDWTPGAIMYTFLDECISRFVRKSTFYHDLLSTVGGENSALGQITPLFAVLQEQWPFFVRSNGSPENDSERVNAAEWLSRYVGYSKQVGEPKALLSSIRDALQDVVEDKACRSKFKKAFKNTSEELENEKTESTLEPNGATSSTSTPAITENTSKLFQMPPEEGDSHPALNRHDKEEIIDALEEGHIGNLILYLSSKYDEIRSQATQNLQQFMTKLQVSHQYCQLSQPF